MFITPSFKKSLIVEQFQGNYLKGVPSFNSVGAASLSEWHTKLKGFISGGGGGSFLGRYCGHSAKLNRQDSNNTNLL